MGVVTYRGYDFDSVNEFVVVPSPSVEADLQVIHDAIRGYEAEPWNMQVPQMIEAQGKKELDAGPPQRLVEVLFDFIGWKLKFEDRGGPAWTRCTTKGGSIIGDGGASDPIEPSAFVSPGGFQAVGGTLFVTGGVGTPDEVSDAVWSGQTSGPSTGGDWAVGTFGRIVRAILTVAKFLGLSK